MDSIIIRYEDNGLVRYDGKEYVESLSKVRREKRAPGALQIGQSVTVKTKSSVWKAVVIDPEPSAATNSDSQSLGKRQPVRVKTVTRLNVTSYRLTVHRSRFANDN